MAKKKKKAVKKKAKRPAAKKKAMPKAPINITTEQKIWALLSYICILFILPLVFKRNDYFIRFHAKQGLVFFVAAFATSIFWLVPIIGWTVSSLLSVILLVFWAMAMIQVLFGHIWRMPLLGKWSEEMKI